MSHAVPATLGRVCVFLPALAAVSFAGAAQAQAQDTFARHDPGSLAVAAFMQEARTRQAAAARAGALDHTPPVLHKLVTKGHVNVQEVDQHITVMVKVTDDLSGVVSYLVEYRSPTGMHHVARLKTQPAPQPNLTTTLTVGAAPYSEPPFLVFAEPGNWVADKLVAMDAAGNVATYDEVALRRFGSTSFFVSNSGGYDNTPPVLASGVIDTPNVRLSQPPKGLPDGTPPYVTADISMTDAGNGLVSGVYAAYLTFCLPGCSDSFVMSGRSNRIGLVATTLTAGDQLRVGQRPGNYEIQSLEMVDSAGSSQTVVSTSFGGTFDFHPYFPQGVNVFLDQ